MEEAVNESGMLKQWRIKLANLFKTFRRADLKRELAGAEAFKEVVKAICASVETSEELKRLYQAVIPCLDRDGFLLFHAAQEITGFSLSREFPYEDACGCFEFLSGFELLRYLEASEFDAVNWEPVSDTCCKKAVLKEVDKSTPAHREFERQLYKRALEHLGLRATAPAKA